MKYISITITHYAGCYTMHEVHYYMNDGNNIISTWDKLTVDAANKLMWELVKLGGKNRYRTNLYNNAISYREVVFYGDI